MAPRLVRYYFGRLNVMGSYEHKDKFLLEGLRAGAIIKSRGYNWQFFKIESHGTDAGLFVSGFLGKYKPETEEEVAVPEKQEFTDEMIENRVMAKSRFLLHVPSCVMGYHPVGSLITRQAFCGRFPQVFEAGFRNFFVSAEIQAIPDEKSFREAIRTFSVISTLRVYLHPSNPNLRDVWKRTDERLKQLGVTDYYEQFRTHSPSSTLRIADDPEIDAKIAMAEDGYGKAEVTGLKDDKEKTVSTGDNPVNVLAPPDEESAEGVLHWLQTTFAELLSRFNK